MDQSLVRKIEKAKDYAEQRHRVTFTGYRAQFRGNNSDHTITYEVGRAICSCNYFAGHSTCSHTMAMELLLEGMVIEDADTSYPPEGLLLERTEDQASVLSAEPEAVG